MGHYNEKGLFRSGIVDLMVPVFLSLSLPRKTTFVLIFDLQNKRKALLI